MYAFGLKGKAIWALHVLFETSSFFRSVLIKKSAIYWLKIDPYLIKDLDVKFRTTSKVGRNVLRLIIKKIDPMDLS